MKTRWSLSVDQTEKTALASLLTACPTVLVTVETAVIGSSTPTTTPPAPACHPAYSPCLPNLPGDALNCGDLASSLKPVTVLVIGIDPYGLDGNNDGLGCT